MSLSGLARKNIFVWTGTNADTLHGIERRNHLVGSAEIGEMDQTA